MKRILIFTAIIVVLFSAVFPCFAEETASEDAMAAEVTVDETAEDDVGWDWLSQAYEDGISFLGLHADEIAAAIILISSFMDKKKTKVVTDEVLPKVKEQGKVVIDMAEAAGNIIKENKAAFFENLTEMKKILNDDEEREKRLLAALDTEHKTTEQYQALCEQYVDMLHTFAAAAISQGAMTYEALMSAKLTDVRKEEIEKEYLKNKAMYEEILSCEIGGADDEAEDE